MPRVAGLHLARRGMRGLRRPANWLQLARFAVVGATGWLINVCVFSLLVETASVHYLPAATIAFTVAVANNFLLNRHWTFNAGGVRAVPQARRFLVVSVTALALNLAALDALVQLVGLNAILAQTLAIGIATPISFTANKLWSFSATARTSG